MEISAILTADTGPKRDRADDPVNHTKNSLLLLSPAMSRHFYR